MPETDNVLPMVPPSLPNQLEELDRLRLQLAEEKARRHQAEMQNLMLAKQRLDMEAQQLQATNQAVSEAIRSKYSLGTADEVDLTTGLIKRAPKPPPSN